MMEIILAFVVLDLFIVSWMIGKLQKEIDAIGLTVAFVLDKQVETAIDNAVIKGLTK